MNHEGFSRSRRRNRCRRFVEKSIQLNSTTIYHHHPQQTHLLYVEYKLLS